MRIAILLLLVTGFANLFAQSGNYLLTHYSPGEERLDNVCFQLGQDNAGIMYFATRTGIMEYDGKSWRQTTGKGPVYTIQVAGDGQVYWGGANGFGKVVMTDSGVPELLSVTAGIRNIFQSIQTTGGLYFLNDEALFFYDIKTTMVRRVDTTESTGILTGIFEIFGELFISTASNGVFQLNGDRLIRPAVGFDFSKAIVFAIPFQDKAIIGFSTNEVVILEQNQIAKPLVLEDQEYLNRSVIVGACWVTNDLVVLGTLRGGLVFVNAFTGKTYEIINYSKGLPDNEIFALFSDRSQSVWAAHEFGFTRIAPFLPFRSFTHYSGLHGNVLCARSFGKSVYVGTSLGLFALEKEEIFEEITYYVDAPDRRRRRNNDTAETDMSSGTVPSDSRRRGFLGLFKRRPPAPAADAATAQPDENLRTSDRQRGKVRMTEKVLRSSGYVFRKVEGIDAKVTHLADVQGDLIASGLGGTFAVRGLKGSRVSEEPARFLYAAADDRVYVSTYSDQVKVLEKTDGAWKVLEFVGNLSDQITYIFEGADNELWMCALDKVYRVQRTGNDVQDIGVFEIDNPNYDEFAGIPLASGCLLVNSQGFYNFNSREKRFEKATSVSDGDLSSYFVSNNQIWYKDVHGWKAYGENSDARTLGLLNLFHNIRFLAADKESPHIWIVAGNNELYKYFTDWITPNSANFPLILRSIRNGTQTLKISERVIELDQENSSLTLEVIQPDFLASQAIEYRYQLEGHEQQWTEWSTKNLIEIPYLPAGDHVVEVQARDIFGNVQTLSDVNLVVLPPYWKRPWFYALEVLVFSALVLLSFRLSIRYRFVSRLLMLLTIIMLIQFIETVVGQTFETKTSPVIDFFIQVLIAMVVLPIEGYLRDLMLRSLESNNRFYRFIYPKGNTPTDAN